MTVCSYKTSSRINAHPVLLSAEMFAQLAEGDIILIIEWRQRDKRPNKVNDALAFISLTATERTIEVGIFLPDANNTARKLGEKLVNIIKGEHLPQKADYFIQKSDGLIAIDQLDKTVKLFYDDLDAKMIIRLYEGERPKLAIFISADEDGYATAKII